MNRLRLVRITTMAALGLGLAALTACTNGEATSSARIAPVAATPTSSTPSSAPPPVSAAAPAAAPPVQAVPAAPKPADAAPKPPPTSANTAPPVTVAPEVLAAATNPTFGTIVTARNGMTLYGLDSDTVKPPKSNCVADCAKRFPPLLLAPNATVEVRGVDKALVGRITRADGSVQVTLAGRPLYRFAGDTAPGDTAGNGLAGGFVITPTAGKAIARKS